MDWSKLIADTKEFDFATARDRFHEFYKAAEWGVGVRDFGGTDFRTFATSFSLSITYGIERAKCGKAKRDELVEQEAEAMRKAAREYESTLWGQYYKSASFVMPAKITTNFYTVGYTRHYPIYEFVPRSFFKRREGMMARAEKLENVKQTLRRALEAVEMGKEVDAKFPSQLTISARLWKKLNSARWNADRARYEHDLLIHLGIPLPCFYDIDWSIKLGKQRRYAEYNDVLPAPENDIMPTTLAELTEWVSGKWRSLTKTTDPSERLHFALVTLTPREEQAIRLKYGTDEKPLTFREVGSRLGVSGSRAEQIVKKSLRKLANPVLAKSLSALIDV